MGPGGKELVDHIGEKETIIYVLYKNDQTGLFCHHIPNVLYMHNNQKKIYTGSNKMKDKLGYS